MHLGAQRHLDSICKAVDASKHSGSTLNTKFDVFGCETAGCLVL